MAGSATSVELQNDAPQSKSRAKIAEQSFTRTGLGQVAEQLTHETTSIERRQGRQLLGVAMQVEYFFHCRHLVPSRITFHWRVDYDPYEVELQYRKIENIDGFTDKIELRQERIEFGAIFHSGLCHTPPRLMCFYRFSGALEGFINPSLYAAGMIFVTDVNPNVAQRTDPSVTESCIAHEAGAPPVCPSGLGRNCEITRINISPAVVHPPVS